MSRKKKGSTQVLGFLEEQAIKQVQKTISSGKDAEVNKILDRYGKEGLEEYLIASDLDPRPGKQSVLDPSVAKKYYMMSADKGHALGQFSMALMYLQGTHGTEKDEKTAVKLMKLSANQGCASALYNRAKWFIDGTMDQEKNPKKAYKLLGKAKKDPLMDLTGGGADIYLLLSTMRLQGNGCTKNPESAQEYLYAAERLQPGRVPKEVFDMTQLMVGLSPVSSQRESDLRWRRIKVAVRTVGRQTLNFWANLHAHNGMPFSISPSSTGDGDMVVNFRDMQEWKIRVGCIDQLPETYPAMAEPLPPLECENSKCDVDETQIKGSMKKCSECQAPYCSETCQRADWPKHKPVCNAISAQINDDNLTDHDKEYLRGMDPDKLKGLGLSHADLENFLSQPTKKCDHEEFGIPCSKNCLEERGAVTQNKRKYTLVGRKELTDADKGAASRLGLKIPTEL